MKPTARLFYIALFFSFMLFQTQAIAQKTQLSATSTSNQTNELKQIREDIASLKNAVKEINNNFPKTKENSLDTKYIEILEKTNQQLTSSWVPTSVSIAILEVFIAVIAVAAAYSIHRQGKDFRDRLEQDRSEHKKALEDFLKSQKSIIEERSKKAEKVEEKINEIINGYEKKLQATTGEQKEEINKALLELKRQKATLQVDIGEFSATAVPPIARIRGSSLVALECPKCKHRFRDTSLRILGHTCPSCGEVFGHI